MAYFVPHRSMRPCSDAIPRVFLSVLLSAWTWKHPASTRASSYVTCLVCSRRRSELGDHPYGHSLYVLLRIHDTFLGLLQASRLLEYSPEYPHFTLRRASASLHSNTR